MNLNELNRTLAKNDQIRREAFQKLMANPMSEEAHANYAKVVEESVASDNAAYAAHEAAKAMPQEVK